MNKDEFRKELYTLIRKTDGIDGRIIIGLLEEAKFVYLYGTMKELEEEAAR